ncbi:oleosin-B3, partial [Aplysia californica]|uniref:Oleosin-B3 n=1 Tax=Aplysia californica TaxID=6500 RepID=A0ABM1A5T9_APLCA
AGGSDEAGVRDVAGGSDEAGVRDVAGGSDEAGVRDVTGGRDEAGVRDVAPGSDEAGGKDGGAAEMTRRNVLPENVCQFFFKHHVRPVPRQCYFDLGQWN